jgi:hypothetical protein
MKARDRIDSVWFNVESSLYSAFCAKASVLDIAKVFFVDRYLRQLILKMDISVETPQQVLDDEE